MRYPLAALLAAFVILVGCSHKNASTPAATGPAASRPAPFLPADPDTQILLANLDKTHIVLLNLTGMRLDMAVMVLNSQYPQKIDVDWATLQFAGLPPSAPVTLHAENLSERELLDQLFETVSSRHPPLKLTSRNGVLQISRPFPRRTADPGMP